MIEAITQETLHLILPMKVSQLAVLMSQSLGITTREALKKIYVSNTYKTLEDERTKLWHLGPVGLLEYYMENK